MAGKFSSSRVPGPVDDGDEEISAEYAQRFNVLDAVSELIHYSLDDDDHLRRLGIEVTGMEWERPEEEGVGRLKLTTLPPGESFEFPVFELDPHLKELVDRGVVTLAVRQGPAVETAPHHFELRATFLIDGRPWREVVISWDEQPLPLWRRLTRSRRFSNWVIGVVIGSNTAALSMALWTGYGDPLLTLFNGIIAGVAVGALLWGSIRRARSS